MINEKDLTIIIPHLGSTKEQEYALEQCLLSLKETVPEIDILVAKNGEQCNHDGDIWVHQQGQCGAVNTAVETTDTEWIMVSNDDHIYPNGWFEKLTEDMDDIYCISPKLVEPNPQHAPTFDYYFCGGAGGDFDKQKWLDFAKSYQGQGLRTGFNLPFLIKRDLWNLIDKYDINYDPFGSNGDSDLEYKIKLAGVQPYQNTNCVVYHFSQTSGTFFPENQAYWNKNWNYFIEKWGFPRTDNGIWEASFSIPTKEEGRIYNPDWEGKYEKKMLE